MKYSDPKLTNAREEMRSKSELYRSTAFWDGASAEIENDLCENGIENFRSLTNTLGYFAPNYGLPTNGFPPDQPDGHNLWLRGNHPQAIKPQLALQQFQKGRKAAPKIAVGLETLIQGDDYLAMLPPYELLERSVNPYGYRTVHGFDSELLLLRRK